jgi:quercetin dioxygenase-like cupin family protein
MMTWKLKASTAFALLFYSCMPAFAEDPVEVDPAHHKVEFENDQVRVLRINFAPGETSVMHSHPCLIAVGVTDSKLLFHFPDGSTRNAELKTGQVVVAKPTTHQPENQTSEPSEVIVVELKSGNCERREKTAGSLNELLSLPVR